MKLIKTEKKKEELMRIVGELWKDDTEDTLVQAGASILFTKGDTTDPKLKFAAELKIKKMLEDAKTCRWALRGLTEFPLASVSQEVIRATTQSDNYYVRNWGIRALGGYCDDLGAVRALADVYRRDNNEEYRLNAIISLGKLEHAESEEVLLKALSDDNSEIRVQASKALKSLLGEEEATRILIQEVLKVTLEQEELSKLTEAFRRIDPSKKFSVNFLSRELDSQDLNRAQLARTFLTELGGWGALRKSTLDSLDEVLRTSEKAVNDLFNDTTRQARRNFYFAMSLNTVIVFIGLTLVAIAVSQLIINPGQLASWIVPGAGGVFGVILSMYFNGPRKNAQKDLATLMNANVIYIGFLRRLTNIDATFKHLYIENQRFDISDMETIVRQIDEAVTSTIKSIEAIGKAEEKESSLFGRKS